MMKRRPGFFAPTLETLEDRVTPSSAPLVSESFDTTALGALPAGWSQWQNAGGPQFAVDNQYALSPSQGLSSTATISWASARAWVNQSFSPNIEVSAAVYTNSAIPVQLLARGSNLNTGNGSYYALSVKEGLEVKLQTVVGGTTTTIGLVQSKYYLSNQWVRATFNLLGSTLRAQIVRLDTNQYLAADGSWQAAPTWALTVNDTTLTGNYVGLARPGSYAGSWYADDFQVYTAAGDEVPPSITLSPPAAPLTGVVPLTATVTDNSGVTRVEFYVDGGLRATDTAAPYTFPFDSSTAVNGTHTLTVKAYDVAGNIGTLNLTVQTLNANSLEVPAISSNFSHIQVAQLIYSPSQLDAAGTSILQNDTDLVVTDSTALSQQVHAVAPNVTQLLYTNVSTLYQSSLTSWLTYARANGISEEGAFLHVTTPTPFTGNSPSSQPVSWFWGVYLGSTQPTQGTFSDQTLAAHGAGSPFSFGAAGQSVYIGYLELFREIDLTLTLGAAYGWSGRWSIPPPWTPTATQRSGPA